MHVLGARAPIGVVEPGAWMWVQRSFPVAEPSHGWVARMLLDWRAMRTTAGSTNPWGTSIDDGWKDLVVSSAPPPPPAREEAPVKNRTLPADMNTWQEHGAARGTLAPAVPVVDEPSFSKSDRRMWVIAGTLMGAAALVPAVLGVLTFGSPVAAPQPASSIDPPVAVAAPAARPTSAARTQVAAVMTKSSNPRILKAASHSSKARHRKRVAAR